MNGLRPQPRSHRRETRTGGRAARGFTLIELMVVMTLIALLLTLAVPRYFGAIDKGRLTVQRQNLATIRDAIDKHYGDLGRYPDSLEDLVSKRYLREVPVDPVTERSDWLVIAPSDPTQGALYDVQPASGPVATPGQPAPAAAPGARS